MLVNDTKSRVEFRPGSDNEVPDFLSRYKAPENNCANDDVEWKEYYIDEMKYRQYIDNKINKLKQQICDKLKPDHYETKIFYDLRKYLIVPNGIVF